MSEQWYYAQGGESHGPLSRRELKELAQNGEINSTTLVWKEGMEDWVAAGTLGLKEGPPPIKPPLPPSVPSKVASTKPAALPPAPPTRYTAPPPRPVSAGGNPTTTVVAAGVALLAGLAIGWLGHAMLAAPREKPVAKATSPAPATKPSMATQKPATGPAKPAVAPIPPANSASPVAGPAAAPTEVPETPPLSSPPPAATPSAAPANPAHGPPPASTSGTVGEAEPPSTPASTPPAGTTPNAPSHNAPSSSSALQRKLPAQTLYQEIDVQRASKMPILETISQTQYQFLSQLEVSDPDAEGIRTVGQTVLDTKLLKADELSQAQLAESLKKIKGWQFSYKLSKDGEVLQMMAGPADAPVAGKVAPKGAEGFIVTSVMDEAGWKELAQISFYVPDEQASGNKRQVRQMTHDFGPLGSFAGETSFVRKGMQEGLLRIDYAHKVAYRAPGKGAAIAGSPITISGADLRPDIAGGSIWYDQKARRVRQAEDYFHVKGEIATNLAALPVEEQQAMIVKLTDVNPWNK